MLDLRHVYLSFDGRIPRKIFWRALVLVACVELICHLVAYDIEGERASAIVSLAFSYPEFAVLAKRGFDRNISVKVTGAFFLLSVLIDFVFVIGAAGGRDTPSVPLLFLSVPWMIFALVLLVELGFRRGTVGPNRYGPDPLATAGPLRRTGGGGD